jgi:fucose 4-O-acetylase-like acetyltransferase
MGTVEKKYSLYQKALGLPLLDKKRLEWVDYLRGIVVILVVYHHARIGIELSGVPMPEFLVTANIVFYSFRIPLFFLVSGLFFSRTINKLSTKKFVSIKFENLLYPYLIWAFIQITAQILLSGYTNSNRSPSDYLYIFYQPRKLDQFYYLPALFNVTMICLMIKTWLKPKPLPHLLLAASLYMVSHTMEHISILSDWMTFYIFFAIGDALSQLFFTNRLQSLFSRLSTFLIAIPIFAIIQFIYLKMDIGQSVIPNADWSEAPKLNALQTFFDRLFFLVIVMVGCFTVTTFSFQLSRWKILSYLRVIGYHSLQVYVMHVLIVGLTRVVLKSYFNVFDPYLLLLACIIVGVIVPVIFYNLFVKNNWLWFLFHIRKHSRPTNEIKTVSERQVSLKPIENT